MVIVIVAYSVFLLLLSLPVLIAKAVGPCGPREMPLIYSEQAVGHADPKGSAMASLGSAPVAGQTQEGSSQQPSLQRAA